MSVGEFAIGQFTLSAGDLSQHASIIDRPMQLLNPLAEAWIWMKFREQRTSGFRRLGSGRAGVECGEEVYPSYQEDVWRGLLLRKK